MVYFKDKMTGNEILSASSSLQCKQLARNIASYDHSDWSIKAKELCYPGIKSKFEQNPSLMEVLQKTGKKTLIEACYDSLWGTGIPLHSIDCLIKRKWECISILGKILMEIHDHATAIFGSNTRVEECMSMNSINSET